MTENGLTILMVVVPIVIAIAVTVIVRFSPPTFLRLRSTRFRLYCENVGYSNSERWRYQIDAIDIPAFDGKTSEHTRVKSGCNVGSKQRVLNIALEYVETFKNTEYEAIPTKRVDVFILRPVGSEDDKDEDDTEI